jgi:hypothetical protein
MIVMMEEHAGGNGSRETRHLMTFAAKESRPPLSRQLFTKIACMGEELAMDTMSQSSCLLNGISS